MTSSPIRTEFFEPEKGRYLHPEWHQPLTHWEAARLQTFQGMYFFCGSKIEIARQIGNAVPPKPAEAAVRRLTNILSGRPKEAAVDADGRLHLSRLLRVCEPRMEVPLAYVLLVDLLVVDAERAD